METPLTRHLLERSAYSTVLRIYFPFELVLSALITFVFFGTYVWSEPTADQNNIATWVGITNLMRWVWWLGYMKLLCGPIDRFATSPSHERFNAELIRAARHACQSLPANFAGWNFFLAAAQWMTIVVVADANTWFGDQSPLYVASGLIWALAPAVGGYVFSLGILKVILANYAIQIGHAANVMELAWSGERASLRSEIVIFALCLTFAPITAFVAHGLRSDLRRQWDIARLQVQNDALRYARYSSGMGGSTKVSFTRSFVPKDAQTRDLVKRYPKLFERIKDGARSVERKRRGVAATVVVVRDGYVGAVISKPVVVPPQYVLSILLMLIAIGIWAPLCAIFLSTTVRGALERVLLALRSVRSDNLSRYQRVPVADANEVAELSIVANEMLSRLETSEAAISEMLFQLQDKNAKLADSFAAKSHFIANMSHELRTPLNAIIGFSRMTLRRAERGEIETEGLKKNMRIIQQSGEHLLTLVNDLLDFEKIEARAMQVSRENVVVYEVVHSLVETLQLSATDKGLTIDVDTIDPDLVIVSDNERFRQILTNLIGNAIKYSDSGTVRVTTESVGNDVVIKVADEGIGIPVDRLSTIFEPFRQAEEEISRTRDGAGLGLAIVSRLCGLLDARIEVDSEVGVGSVFTLTVPKADVRRTSQSKDLNAGADAEE